MKCWSRALGIVAGALAMSCEPKNEGAHDHSDDHPEGHDHHEEGHGHVVPVQRHTKWSDQFELFAEHPPLVAGKKASLLIHLTVLDEFRPLERARLRLELEGQEQFRAGVAQPLHAGVFRIEFTAPKPGKYKGRLVVDGPVSGSLPDLPFEVFKTQEQAHAKVPEEPHEGLIELLKEQQWGVPFATSFAAHGTLVPAIQVAGSVDTPPGGMAVVGAPVPGRLVAPAKGLARPGEQVKKGQLLASLLPAPASPEASARAELAVSEAEARKAAARSAHARAKRLIVDEAISQAALEEAERELAVADEALRAAKRAQALFSGAQSGGSAGAWRLTAPIAGTLTDVNATPGASVAPKDVLFRIVNPNELWIRARVPEQDAGRLRSDRDAQYQVAGRQAWKPIQLSGADATATLVTIGKTVDPVSRTVDVIYSLEAPDPALRVGGLVQVSLPTGADFEGVIAPSTALVNEEGRELVYVQVDGEHFEERLVKPGPRAGHHVGIQRGLKAGERIVVRGAHLVRLADRTRSSEAPHGHVH